MRAYFSIVALFILAQLLGIYTGSVLAFDLGSNPYARMLEIPGSGAPESALYLFGYVLLGTVFLTLMIRYLFRFTWIFLLLELLMVSTASSLVFYAIFRLFLGYVESMASGVLLGMMLAAAKAFRPSLKNAAVVLAAAGAGALLGVSLGLRSAVVWLALISVYDYVAVYRLGHMVELAHFFTRRELAFTITARNAAPVGKARRIDLGSGDLLTPVMLETAALPLGLITSFWVMTGASLALMAFFAWAGRKKAVFPAVPPIVLGGLLSLLLARLLS